MGNELKTAEDGPPSGHGDLAGKYLTFELGTEIYGLEILKVQEIIGIMSITNVPKTPDYVRGVINLRGKVIPVVELRKKFSMPTMPDTERTCIIVVQIQGRDVSITMGILVDEVSEVVDIASDRIEAAPTFGTGVNTAFIMAMGKIGERVVILLDADKVLTIEDIEDIEVLEGAARE
ncbi:MAG: chemotaxis protein CheW [Candidatus Hydrogenedentes bacterium]|nr:chemotaxis protein CheW [Candidatus Hydrogenedentota bacterium]